MDDRQAIWKKQEINESSEWMCVNNTLLEEKLKLEREKRREKQPCDYTKASIQPASLCQFLQ